MVTDVDVVNAVGGLTAGHWGQHSLLSSMGREMNIVAYWLLSEGLMWLIKAMERVRAAPRVQQLSIDCLCKR